MELGQVSVILVGPNHIVSKESTQFSGAAAASERLTYHVILSQCTAKIVSLGNTKRAHTDEERDDRRGKLHDLMFRGFCFSVSGNCEHIPFCDKRVEKIISEPV